jgi:hypothetical protein
MSYRQKRRWDRLTADLLALLVFSAGLGYLAGLTGLYIAAGVAAAVVAIYSALEI